MYYKMLFYTPGFLESVGNTLLKVKYKQNQAIPRNLVVCLEFDEVREIFFLNFQCINYLRLFFFSKVHLKKDISYDNVQDKFIG